MKTIEGLITRRWRIAISLTIAMVIVYFGFIGLIAFQKETMGTEIFPGLSLGILLGAMVIVAAWALTYIYVRWANSHFDAHVDTLRSSKDRGDV